MTNPLDDAALDVLFRDARSQNVWQDKPVSAETLQAIYDLMKWGPTSANCFPIRIVFAHTQAEKDRLSTMVMEGNIEKVRKAAAVAIMGYDTEFYEELPTLFPHDQTARSWFSDAPVVAQETAFRNSSLQGAYLMIAARAMGLDVGAMSGFSNEVVDEEFFSETGWKSNFLCNIGYADEGMASAS